MKLNNKDYWQMRADARMDNYLVSALDTASTINRSYGQLRQYIKRELESILRNVGDDVAAYEWRMKRLNILLVKTEKHLQDAYGLSKKNTTAYLKSIIPEAYYHTIFDISQISGVMPVFAAVNDRLISTILRNKWSGEHYSKRIWRNNKLLEKELKQVLTTAAMTGESIYKTANRLNAVFNTSAYNVQRIIRTETTYACNQAELQSYAALDIERYEYVATLDTRTSPQCRELDGKIFPLSKAQAGTNLPPMHPNCRSTTIPYFEGGRPKFRTARDKDGNRIQVPASMKYDQWYQKYIDPNHKIPKTKSPTLENKPQVPEKPKFTPAKTKEEAIDYAKRFSQNVNFDGISLDNANAINEAFTEMTAKYPIKKLETMGKDRTSGAMSANWKSLKVNGNQLGKALENDSALFEKSQEQARKSIEIIKERWSGKAKIPFRIESDIAKLERQLKFKRWGVQSSYPNRTKNVTIHEYGHILSDQYFGMVNKELANPNYSSNWSLKGKKQVWEEAYKKARETGDIFNISAYADTNVLEFFAESFLAREMGEQLPEYIESLMVEVLKNGIM